MIFRIKSPFNAATKAMADPERPRLTDGVNARSQVRGAPHRRKSNHARIDGAPAGSCTP
jgi:hypothetical protein